MRKFLLQQTLEKYLFSSTFEDMPNRRILSVIGSQLQKSTGSLKLQIFDATSYETILAQIYGLERDVRVSYSAHEKDKLVDKYMKGHLLIHNLKK